MTNPATPRRPRGSVKDGVTPAWKIQRHAKARIDAVAKRAGISSSYLVELMAENLELTDQGIPSWLPEIDRSQELPIDQP